MHTKRRYWLDACTWILFLSGAIAAFCIQSHYHKILEPDTLSYINIGELYAAGKFQLAINGYWSPFYSWLIALMIKMGAQPLITCYCINITAAGACFFFLQKLGQKYLHHLIFYMLFLLCSMITLLGYALMELTPDLLGTAFILLFLTLVWSAGFNGSARISILAGFAGALMFLAKSYNFLFLNLFFVVLFIAAWRMPVEKKKPRLMAIGRAWAVFWLFSLLWIVPLSIHEGQPVFSTAGTYSHNTLHPVTHSTPIMEQFLPPPFEEAYTAWINPSHELDDQAWAVFGSRRNFYHQGGVILINIRRWYKWLSDIYFIKISVLLLCIISLASYDKLKRAALFSDIKPWLLVFFLYPVGYLPFFVMGRYIFIETLLLWLLLFYVVQETARRFSRPVSFLPVLAAIALFLLASLQTYRFVKWKVQDYHSGDVLYANLPKLEFLREQRMVTNRSSYITAIQLCYRLHVKLYGIWSEPPTDKVQQYGVKYLLTDTPRQEPFLRSREIISSDPVRIYVYEFIYNPVLPSAQ